VDAVDTPADERQNTCCCWLAIKQEALAIIFSQLLHDTTCKPDSKLVDTWLDTTACVSPLCGVVSDYHSLIMHHHLITIIVSGC
jgi:hypothetical protein